MENKVRQNNIQILRLYLSITSPPWIRVSDVVYLPLVVLRLHVVEDLPNTERFSFYADMMLQFISLSESS